MLPDSPPGDASDARDEDWLVRCLAALASSTRLDLLRALRTQSRLSELDVRVESGDGRPRRLARQTVTFHLETLVAVGLAQSRVVERDGEPVTEFFLNHQRLYALAEEVRALARMRPSVEPDDETLPRRLPAAGPRRAPVLVLVRGLDEGATFDLSPRRADDAWVVGRSRSCDVPLDFDLAVSHQNAVVRWDGTRHALEDVPGSRNGTTHNFRRLAPGERVPLAHGDLVGVGTSLLAFWA